MISPESTVVSDSESVDSSLQSRPQRKARPKRSNHNELERKRRLYQRSKLDQLRDSVPSMRARDKPSTVVIMEKAKDYIDQLKGRIESLQMEIERFRNLGIPNSMKAYPSGGNEPDALVERLQRENTDLRNHMQALQKPLLNQRGFVNQASRVVQNNQMNPGMATPSLSNCLIGTSTGEAILDPQQRVFYPVEQQRQPLQWRAWSGPGPVAQERNSEGERQPYLNQTGRLEPHMAPYGSFPHHQPFAVQQSSQQLMLPKPAMMAPPVIPASSIETHGGLHDSTPFPHDRQVVQRQNAGDYTRQHEFYRSAPAHFSKPQYESSWPMQAMSSTFDAPSILACGKDLPSSPHKTKSMPLNVADTNSDGLVGKIPSFPPVPPADSGQQIADHELYESTIPGPQTVPTIQQLAEPADRAPSLQQIMCHKDFSGLL